MARFPAGSRAVDLGAEPAAVDGVEPGIKGSFGISMYPEDSDDLEALIHQADRAMYREKQEHRSD